MYAQILGDLGLLSKGDCIFRKASDFVGSALGQSEQKSRAILKEAEGCVLVIDEAYGLHAGGGVGSSAGSGVDPYRRAVIDTLVEEVQNVPGEDRVVIMLGYRDEMEDMLKNNNPGLERRFQLQNAFQFDDYGGEELMSILNMKLRAAGLRADMEARMAAIDVLAHRRRLARHFGNAGEVDNLLNAAKERMEQRAAADDWLVAADFDEEHGRAPPSAEEMVEELFGDLVGCDAVKKVLHEYRNHFLYLKKRGKEPLEKLQLNFRFVGSPGTGKTVGSVFSSSCLAICFCWSAP
jgi:AAA lid domain/ATPase family associated with various cellular activities (AAA)